jgi:hypothetical protein
MGNRAVITFAPYKKSNVGIYLHWNGGRASVEGFLQACHDLGYRTPGGDSSYAMARLIGAIGAFLGGSLSLGVGLCKDLDCDNGDNGLYVIGPDWVIAGREHIREGFREEEDPEKTRQIADQIKLKIAAAEAASITVAA